MREHKKQLHDRIIQRQSQLQSQLEQMEQHRHTTRSQREVALADALSTLEIHLATGWQNVGEVEAEELSRWLEASRFLVDDSRADDRAASIRRQLQAQWKLLRFGVPGPAAKE